MLYTDLPTEVAYVGQISLGDMTTALGFQVQPAIADTDFLWSINPGAFGNDTADINVDAAHRCIYPTPILVPHNQRTGSAALDQDQFLLASVPSLYWDIDIPDSGVTLQNLRDGHWGHQTIAATAAIGADPRALTLYAGCSYWEGPDGLAEPLNAQEVEIWLSRSLFTRVDPSSNAPLSVYFKIGGYWYAVGVSATRAAQVARSADGGEDDEDSTYQNIKGQMFGGKPSADAMGANGGIGGRAGDMVIIRAAIYGGRVGIVAGGGGATPLLNPLQRDTRTPILNFLSETAVEVPAGSANRLPPTPFVAQAWDGAGIPTTSGVRDINIVDKSAGTGYQGRDVLILSGDMGGIRIGGTIDILDPRITDIRIAATGYSHLSFAAHLKKYRAQATLISPVKQLGYVPLVQTPISYTVYGPVDAANVSDGGTFTPYGFDPSSGAGATISTESADGSTLAYEIDIANPVPVATLHTRPVGPNGYPSYGGEEYADETITLTKATVRIAGLEKPPPNAFTKIYLGVGGTAPVKSVSEQIGFDPASLTIRHSGIVTLDNNYGVAALQQALGVGVSGNVGVAVRMGYQHQRYLSDTDGIGFSRLWGYSDSRDLSTPPGGAGATMALNVLDQMQWLSEVPIAAPLNLDGHNHYWAIAYLAQVAGIPLRRMAFASLVPDDPFDYAFGDPDPYFLPVGYGFAPWTPINRTLPVGELMDAVRKLTGFLLYIDALGYLRYEPWVPIQQAILGPKRVFTETEYPTIDGRDYNGGLPAMWDLHVGTSTRDVRNQTVLIGIDAEADWQPIVVKLEDLDSIDSAPGSQPLNYKGYRSPFVWMDSRFAAPAFAISSAQKLYRWLRQPAVTVTFSCWPQMDLYPMDIISAVSWRNSLDGTLPLTIMDMSMNVGVMGEHGPDYSCRVTARYLDPVALSG